MKEVILLKYGEMVLKGLNKNYFNSLLIKRVRNLLKEADGNFTLDYSQSTLCIRGDENADMDKAYSLMKKVFGVSTICRGIECEKDMAAIKKALIEHGDRFLMGAKTFKCTAKRSDKRFPLNSMQICAECGEIILENFDGVSVDVNDPEVNITIEIRDRAAFIHGGGEKGACGMPVGSNGKALLLLSGGIDSPVAGYMVAKRGVFVDAVYFESPPYTSEAAKEKVISLAKKIGEYTGRIYLHFVSVTEIQQAIMDNCEEKLFTLLLRRFMMRIAERIADEIHAGALVTGESIGQVASQTMMALNVTDSVVNMPVFRPCIGLDKDEIVTRARSIGTFEISSLPYDDCCSLFTPKHPNTRPTEDLLIEAEKKLDVEGLIERALAGRTYIKIE
ncbi:MAG TPA: tRNA uracil 4-sulfurtransferase ThiI [Bacillota bacterium]|nr:tRNA uracil 4-sulfurtransferase ThiI [Bacillota bacterium]HOK69410.1 tRNA uracil 4-sulfurtransferase ThiI [Bacillota bacterium]HPP85706.1 tRNA uracil 4-sulfurtransferase ThiI [Bacillota bacterium]